MRTLIAHLVAFWDAVKGIPKSADPDTPEPDARASAVAAIILLTLAISFSFVLRSIQ
jgi:hypothetical protein